MRRLVGPALVLSAACLAAAPARAERFTPVAPMPFSLGGVVGTVLPVSAGEAAGTPTCIELSGCPLLFAEADAIYFRVALSAGSASLPSIAVGPNLRPDTVQAGILPIPGATSPKNPGGSRSARPAPSAFPSPRRSTPARPPWCSSPAIASAGCARRSTAASWRTCAPSSRRARSRR